MIGAYIDEIIMFLVGIWATAVGFGMVSAPGKDAAGREQFMGRFGKVFKVIGPALIVIAIVLAVARGRT